MGFHEEPAPRAPILKDPKAAVAPTGWSLEGKPETRPDNPALVGAEGWKVDLKPVTGIDWIERNLLGGGLSSVLYCVYIRVSIQK